jgi:hypothetical protein
MPPDGFLIITGHYRPLQGSSFGVLRYFGNYIIEEREMQTVLVFKSGDNSVHTKPQVAYAYIRTDEKGKDFAIELLKKLDVVALEGIVK